MLYTFFAKNLSLGDEVLIDDKFMVTKVIKPSGQYTYRVWFGESTEEKFRYELVAEFVKLSALLEWYSSNLLAVSCPEEKAQLIADLLFEKEKLGLIYYETGKT